VVGRASKGLLKTVDDGDDDENDEGNGVIVEWRRGRLYRLFLRSQERASRYGYGHVYGHV
jgi:hypothetical protein